MDAPEVSQRLPDCFAKTDSDVLGGMMIIHICIPVAADVQIEVPMPGEKRQHVIQETAAGVNAALAAAVKVQAEGNLCFSCIPFQGCCSHSATSCRISVVFRINASI